MNYLFKKMILVLVLASMALNVFADVVDTGNGSINVGSPGVKYGPSATYNPNGSTKENLENLKKRAKDLKKAKDDLKKKLRKAKGKEAKAKVKEEIEKVSKELKKVFDDYDFEDDLTTDPRKPKKKAEADKWKRKMRFERLQKLKEKQEKWEKEEEKKRQRARRVTDLRDLGDVTIGDVASANTDVISAQRELGDILDEEEEAQCEEINDQNIEICTVLNSNRVQATATLEETRRNFGSLANALPPLLIGRGLYVLFDRMTDLQESYERMRSVQRELVNCDENCDVIARQVENIKYSIDQQEFLDKSALDEAQDELKMEEVGGPFAAQIIIPTYLSENNEVPFANTDELPMIFALETDISEDVVKSAHTMVNGQLVELVYYPERGIFAGNYSGYEAKEDFVGETQIELIDGQVLSGNFQGRINTNKPEVKISSVPGTLLKKGSFKIHVTGEFDKIEISGENVKSQTVKFESMKTSHKMTVKAQSKGSASINVVATRTSKNVKMPEFDGEVLSTDELGRVLRENDLFRSISVDNTKDKELGFCCEEVGDLTCEGCIDGRRTRKSCKALNKLPGYNIKAFLKSSDLTCSKL